MRTDVDGTGAAGPARIDANIPRFGARRARRGLVAMFAGDDGWMRGAGELRNAPYCFPAQGGRESIGSVASSAEAFYQPLDIIANKFLSLSAINSKVV
jgi:hypothetical protein